MWFSYYQHCTQYHSQKNPIHFYASKQSSIGDLHIFCTNWERVSKHTFVPLLIYLCVYTIVCPKNLCILRFTELSCQRDCKWNARCICSHKVPRCTFPITATDNVENSCWNTVGLQKEWKQNALSDFFSIQPMFGSFGGDTSDIKQDGYYVCN